MFRPLGIRLFDIVSDFDIRISDLALLTAAIPAATLKA